MNNNVIYVDFKNKSKNNISEGAQKQSIVRNMYNMLKSLFSFSSGKKSEIKTYNFRKTM